MSSILLLPNVAPPPAVGITLPSATENLYERLIRDPTAPNRPARERLCAEMLCGVLLNAPTARQNLLRWLSKWTGGDVSTFANLDWRFGTEQAIGSKRDDLRIEGWTHEDDRQRVVLWTIEIKVGSGIHFSGHQDFDDEMGVLIPPEEKDLQLVSQIENYDRWLSHEVASKRAGFVLAIDDMSASLPTELAMPWHCVRGAELSLQLEEQLRAGGIPDSELILVRHFCGFVRSHLWNEISMNEYRFKFDDLALMRAFSQIGFNCFSKVMRLATGCKPVLEELLTDSFSKCAVTNALDGPSNRSAAYITFSSENLGKSIPTTLYAGIEGGEARIWIENPQSSSAKPIVQQIVKRLKALLKERNASWEAVHDSSTWVDLQLSKPLDWILTADDQQAALNQFVAAAVNDLKEVGFIAAMRRELQKG
jgi:hypothetical protein